MDERELYLGGDVGGTSCRIKITSADGAVLGEASAEGANARLGAAAVHKRILDTARQAEAAAGVGAHDHARIFAAFGVAGVERPGAVDAILARRFPYAATRMTTDAHIALMGAHSGRDGAVVIVGTGSIGLARRGDLTKRVGGHGFPISDEGSGAYLGLQAMTRTLRVMDGRRRGGALAAELAERFEGSVDTVVAWMDHAAPKDYAALAPRVMHHADAGETMALAIVEAAAGHVTDMVRALLNWGAPACALAGGLSAHIRRYMPHGVAERLTPADAPPIDGAVLLAKAAADQRIAHAS